MWQPAKLEPGRNVACVTVVIMVNMTSIVNIMIMMMLSMMMMVARHKKRALGCVGQWVHFV